MRLRYFIKNENGIALVMVLVLSAISLAIMSVLIFMITSGTKISGMEKRYLNALEAAYGASEDMFAGGDFSILAELKDGGFNQANYNSFTYASSPACVQQKINSNASAANWTACGTFTSTTSKVMDPTDTTTYDFAFNVPINNPTHRAFVKIIDSSMGVTVHKILRTGSVVSPRDVGKKRVPVYLYSFEVLTVNLANSDDRVRLSFLFAQ